MKSSGGWDQSKQISLLSLTEVTLLARHACQQEKREVVKKIRPPTQFVAASPSAHNFLTAPDKVTATTLDKRALNPAGSDSFHYKTRKAKVIGPHRAIA